MKEEFVSYTQALALKELGFDEPCFGYYENDTFIFWYDSRQEYELLLNCSAPLYQQAFRWFREEHDLEHEILYDLGNDLSNKVYLYSIYVTDNRSEEYKTYEEAEQACLDKLIEIVKKR
jgi:hypothetical protein